MFDYLTSNLNNSPVAIGTLILFTNLGGRYMMLDLPTGVEVFFSNFTVRQFIIFFVALMATRNIKTSILIFLLFTLFFYYLFNENSKSCLPFIKKLIDQHNQRIIQEQNKNKQPQQPQSPQDPLIEEIPQPNYENYILGNNKIFKLENNTQQLNKSDQSHKTDQLTL